MILSILIPVYNEREHLERSIERVLQAPLPAGLDRELVLVDDASTDGTRALVEELGRRHAGRVRVFFQERNQGKGAAIRRAIREMRGDFALFQDADLEYDPQDYPALLEPLLDGRADAVYGSRFASRRVRRILNFRHELGNRFLTALSNWFTQLNLTDMETCYKAFRSELLRSIPLRSNRFGIEPEITAKLAKRRCILYEVPIDYLGRSAAEGKKIGWKDGVQAIAIILKYAVMDDCYADGSEQALRFGLSRARRYNRWLASALAPAMGRRILEIESGFGCLSRWLPRRDRLTLSDADPSRVAELKDTWRNHDRVSVERFDPASGPVPDGWTGAFDTVICQQALERLDEEDAALLRLSDCLEPGGRLVLVLPNAPALYGTLDRALGLRRRYSRRRVRDLLARAGLVEERVRGLHAPASAIWWIQSRVLGCRKVGRLSLAVFEAMLPLLHLLHPVTPLPSISLICFARKPVSAGRTA
jgi:glycosyltransferase involved in cell wall biosynthesis